MSTMNCPICSTPAMPGAIFCDNCGYDLRSVPAVQPAPPPAAPAWAPPPAPAGGVTCPQCQHPNIAGAAFCENCGMQLPQAPAPSMPPAPPPVAAPPYQPAPSAPSYPPAAQPTYPPPAPQPDYPPVAPPEAPAYPPPPPPQAPAYPPVAPQPAPAAPQPDYGTGPIGQPPAVPFPQPAMAVSGRLEIQGLNVSLPIPPGRQEILVGREDPVSSIFPDINLDPHGGQEAGISRRHLRISLQGGMLVVEDLNTVNGSALNRQKLLPGQAVPLKDGDELRLGKMVLRFFAQ